MFCHLLFHYFSWCFRFLPWYRFSIGIEIFRQDIVFEVRILVSWQYYNPLNFTLGGCIAGDSRTCTVKIGAILTRVGGRGFRARVRARVRVRLFFLVKQSVFHWCSWPWVAVTWVCDGTKSWQVCCSGPKEAQCRVWSCLYERFSRKLQAFSLFWTDMLWTDTALSGLN